MAGEMDNMILGDQSEIDKFLKGVRTSIENDLGLNPDRARILYKIVEKLRFENKHGVT